MFLSLYSTGRATFHVAPPAANKSNNILCDSPCKTPDTTGLRKARNPAHPWLAHNSRKVNINIQ